LSDYVDKIAAKRYSHYLREEEIERRHSGKSPAEIAGIETA
jgi:hypothetical protein